MGGDADVCDDACAVALAKSLLFSSPSISTIVSGDGALTYEKSSCRSAKNRTTTHAQGE